MHSGNDSDKRADNEASFSTTRFSTEQRQQFAIKPIEIGQIVEAVIIQNRLYGIHIVKFKHGLAWFTAALIAPVYIVCYPTLKVQAKIIRIDLTNNNTMLYIDLILIKTI